ncbi:MAG: helix-turn-helix domain-containing protein, partial [Anaerolineae bacterium]|nr:helix-turn-helix domain-containing protein [Anaerolineae bacterium]
MTAEGPPEVIRLLAHDVRWRIMQALAAGDYRVQELVNQVQEPVNLVSYHLKKLRAEALVTVRRSEADGRDSYYSLDLDHLREQMQAAAAALHPALAVAAPATVRPARPVRVLFVCTHNSARSQMAEGLLRSLGQGQVHARSAGSQPAGVHPDALATMQRLGIDIGGQTSRHVDEFAGQMFDYVITVCDRAREVCPAFPGGQQLHWGFP